MRKMLFASRPFFTGITIGGSGEGQPLSLVILTAIVMLMAFATVYDAAFCNNTGGVDLKKSIPFKCQECGLIVLYKIAELQKMQKNMEFFPEHSGPNQFDNRTPYGPPGMHSMMPGPMMGPLVLDCPKCHKKALTQAVECPKCKEIFVMKMPDMFHGQTGSSDTSIFDDRCPRCGESYAKAWQEKYRREQSNE